jgi:two-component system chemotaxis response regulator CheY
MTMAKTIMTADDSASIRQLVKMALVEAGYGVVEAVDGLDALNKFTASPTNMLITDLNMPNLDGIELIKKVRSTPSGKFIPIVLLTTESDGAKKQAGKLAGATGWIVKPFNKDQLLAVVKKLLG